MTSGLVIVVTGLKREAAILKGPGVRALAGGGDDVRLRALLDQACPGAAGLISIGLGGALEPGLKPGDWVVADAVLTEGERLPADPAWTGRLLERLPGARTGAVAGSADPVADVRAKRALRATTGALVVDMESHIAARAAERHGLPFAVARTISDAADRALPRAALAGMRPDGAMDIKPVLAALARRPWELPALIRTGLEAETAFRALLRGRELLGPALVGPGADLGELVLDVG
jgi:hopanoid-associated phosphorylase